MVPVRSRHRKGGEHGSEGKMNQAMFYIHYASLRLYKTTYFHISGFALLLPDPSSSSYPPAGEAKCFPCRFHDRAGFGEGEGNVSRDKLTRAESVPAKKC